MSLRVLWTPVDGWTDIGKLVEHAGAATVVSRNGSARLFRFGAQGAHHTRVPLEGGHMMVSDQIWRPLDVLVGTPCGVSLLGRAGSHWAMGTPVRLVLEGLHPRWAALPEVRPTLIAVLGNAPLACPSGHPPKNCGALYCLTTGRDPAPHADRDGQ